MGKPRGAFVQDIEAGPASTTEVSSFASPVTGVTCKAVYCEGTGSAGQLTYKHTAGGASHTITLVDNQTQPLTLDNGELTSFTGTNFKYYDW